MFVEHERGLGNHSPMFVYRADNTRQQLDRMRDYDGSPYDGIIVEYCDPATGASVMPTLSYTAQLLRPGEHTLAHRHTANAIYCVIEGSGCTEVEGTRLEWSRNDAFCVPAWMWHEHINAEADAVLYSVTDAPTLKKLALYREEGRTVEGDTVRKAP
jgi:gentisate 1,2-dioxygenase